jgi:putative CocE/NonD family hydrolase
MSVYLDGGRLYEEREGKPRQEMVADDAAGAAVQSRFNLPGSGTHIVFERDASGRLTGCHLVADRDGRTLVEETRISGEGVRVSHYRRYVRSEAMVPMRDGVRLHVAILKPADMQPTEPLPFLMERTPYGTEDYDSASLNLNNPELAASGYIFVYEDIRGRYESGGKFVMNRPVVAHLGKQDVDETTDTRDTIDWLLKNVLGNNGRVGVWGVSYPGFLAMMAGIDAHPAVKAISPQAPMTDVWMGDDFFHNGAFRETYGFDYVQQMEAQKSDVVVESKEDTYDFFLKHVNFAGAAAAAKMSDLPTAKAFLTQPTYSKFWQDMAVEQRLTKVEVPTLEVGGYWDQEDMWGTQAEYAALKPHDSTHEVFLVLGPWNHGGWDGNARKLGVLDFGQPTGTEFRKQFEAPFFEKYLKDRPGFDLADTASFRTGADMWERYSAWPPQKGFEPAKAYLEAGKTLSFSAPSSEADGIAASYVADPADPVPYRHRPIQSTYATGSKWYTWLAEDQSFVSERKDVASFKTPALDHDMTVTGEVIADLFAATTGSDADWVVKLIDEYPRDPGSAMSGYQLMVAEEIFRGRYRTSFERPEPLKPGAVEEFKWSLHGTDHTFLQGHRMIVQVQSSWFPLYDRNPQTFVPNIMTAPPTAYKAETVTIYSSPKWPSHLEFEVAR